MGLITLAGHRVTHARASIPAWGAWYADASVDGDVSLSGVVDLVIEDLTLRGTVISGGAHKGRSRFRIVGGAGGWAKSIPRRSYVNDLGVKLKTVLLDAAEAVGETIDLGDREDERIGPAYVRQEGPAVTALALLAPRAWYVDELGTTRLGRRAPATLDVPATVVSLDRAASTVTIATESIARVLPGVIVEGIEALDVEHEVTPDGLRSTIWGARGGAGSRRREAYRKIVEGVLPDLPYRGLYQYRVVTREGRRLNLQPVRVSTEMPDLPRVRVRPGVAGCETDAALGARVVVAFLDASPTSPVVVAFEDAEGEGFQPESLRLYAGGSAAGEHVATVEGVVVLLHNVIMGLAAAGLPAAWLGSGVVTGVINAAIAASGTPAPEGLAAQIIAAATQTTEMLTGPGATSSPYKSAIDLALSGKTKNESGLFPNIGSKAVEAG